MSTVSRGLPKQPHIEIPKRVARELLTLCRAGDPEALDRVHQRHPRYTKAEKAESIPMELKLTDAQLVIAREYGFKNWAQLKERINANTATELLLKAISADDGGDGGRFAARKSGFAACSIMERELGSPDESRCKSWGIGGHQSDFGIGREGSSACFWEGIVAGQVGVRAMVIRERRNVGTWHCDGSVRMFESGRIRISGKIGRLVHRCEGGSIGSAGFGIGNLRQASREEARGAGDIRTARLPAP